MLPKGLTCGNVIHVTTALISNPFICRREAWLCVWCLATAGQRAVCCLAARGIENGCQLRFCREPVLFLIRGNCRPHDLLPRRLRDGSDELSPV